jgi:hypothetical protein
MGGLLSFCESKGERLGFMVQKLSRYVYSLLTVCDFGLLDQQQHILAARTVANIIRTSLGPRGAPRILTI